MSHFAELDENNIVLRVVVCDNNDPSGDEGYQWLIDNLGGRWVQTSYNGNFRGTFAGIGFLYNEELDIFVTPPKNENSKNLMYDIKVPIELHPYPTTVVILGDE